MDSKEADGGKCVRSSDGRLCVSGGRRWSLENCGMSPE